jgi:hypothetical protein
MTKENLGRANELLPLIAKAKLNVEKWENVTHFETNPGIQCYFNECMKGCSYVDATYIPFDVAKALSLDGFRKELKKLEDEFNAL